MNAEGYLRLVGCPTSGNLVETTSVIQLLDFTIGRDKVKAGQNKIELKGASKVCPFDWRGCFPVHAKLFAWTCSGRGFIGN